MEVSYRRDFNHNYLVLEHNGITGQEYTLRMIGQNGIPELLTCQVRRLNGQTYLYYDVTSKQPVSELFSVRMISSREMKHLLAGIRDALERLHPYLIGEEDILFHPEYIFMSTETKEVRLCYIPLLAGEEQHSERYLAEFILKRLDHSDQAAVQLGYGLYEKLQNCSSSLKQVLDKLLAPEAEAQLSEERRSEQEHNREEQKYSMSRGISQISQKTEGKQEHHSGYGNDESSPAIPKGGAVKRKRNSVKKADAGTILLCAAAVFLLAGIFGGIVCICRLDLTQAGGLACLMLALLWLFSGFFRNRFRKRKVRAERDEQDDEEEFMEALLAQVYNEEYAVGHGKSEKQEYVCEQTFGGETVLLDRNAYGAEGGLILRSLDQRKSHDIMVSQDRMLIGKKKEQVDAVIDHEAVSRVHARVEREGEEYVLTDLNSTNGTFLNRERLQANESRVIRDGDRICFGDLTFRVKKT